MKLSFLGLGGFLLVPFLCLANFLQQKPQQKEAVSAETTSSADSKNPVKPTPENLADAKKFFGFDCAMCHGVSGDGKSSLAASMGLKMNDWRESSKLASLTDGEIFEAIVKGKGRMVGEGDRYPTDTVWELVNYVRTFEKSEASATQRPSGSR